MSKYEKKAKQYLKDTGVTEVSVTSDGFLFLKKKDAINHSMSLEGGSYETYEAEKEVKTLPTPNQTLELNLTELSKTVAKIENVDDIYLLKKKEEEEEKPRKGALAIFDVRIEELLADDKDDSKEGNDLKDQGDQKDQNNPPAPKE